MKTFIMVIMFLSVHLFAYNFSGDWELSTMGGNKKVQIKQTDTKIEMFRTITQDFDGKPYTIQHLITGNINSKQTESQYNLYVKDEELPEFELLRTIPFKIINEKELEIDGTKLILLTPVIGKENKEVKVEIKKEEQTENTNNGEIKVVIIKKNKNTENNDSANIEKKEENQNDSQLAELLPGIGETFPTTVKISKGFSTDEQDSYDKAVRLMKKGRNKQALEIFLSIYSKQKRNISVLIHIIELYKNLNDKKNMNNYCKIVKKYDPDYICGGTK